MSDIGTPPTANAPPLPQGPPAPGYHPTQPIYYISSPSSCRRSPPSKWFRAWTVAYTAIGPLASYCIVFASTNLSESTCGGYEQVPSTLLTTGALALSSLIVFAISLMLRNAILFQVPIVLHAITIGEATWFICSWLGERANNDASDIPASCTVMHALGIAPFMSVCILVLLCVTFMCVHISLLKRNPFRVRPNPLYVCQPASIPAPDDRFAPPIYTENCIDKPPKY